MSLDPKRMANLFAQAQALVSRYRLQLILALRVTVAALLALMLAQALHLRLPIWAVLTSLIVTQASLGRSVKVATDYLVGTLAGVAYGGALAILIPHDSEWALLAVLALAVAPLALAASFKTNFNVLPITAIIVLLVPTLQHVSPAASALDRVLEVFVGAVTGFVVSFLLWPSRAHQLTTEAAATTLELIADALGELICEQPRVLDRQRLRGIQDGIGAALARLNATGAEAEHERSTRLTSGPDTGPLLRTLLRLRHDMVMLGRAAGCELPETVARRLNPRLGELAAAATDFLHESGAALRARTQPPPLDDLASTFSRYAQEFDAIRHDGLTRGMPSEQVERFFALGFALEQLRDHLSEVHRVVREWARD